VLLIDRSQFRFPPWCISLPLSLRFLCISCIINIEHWVPTCPLKLYRLHGTVLAAPVFTRKRQPAIIPLPNASPTPSSKADIASSRSWQLRGFTAIILTRYHPSFPAPPLPASPLPARRAPPVLAPSLHWVNRLRLRLASRVPGVFGISLQPYNRGAAAPFL